MPTMSSIQNSVIGEGRKKKSFLVQKIQCEISTFYGSKMNPTLLPTKQNQSESEQGGIPDPQSLLLEGSSSKTTFVSRCHIPEGSQAQEFKEEQQSTSGTGRSSRRGRIMDVLLHWRGTETHSATSRMETSGWEKLFTNCGATLWFKNLA